MQEKSLEQWAEKEIRKRAGLALKWVCPGQRGVPDRICLFPNGRLIFIEFKRPGIQSDGRSALQLKMAKRLTTLGFTVWRISSKEDLLQRLDDYEV